MLAALRQGLTGETGRRVLGMYVFLGIANLVLWTVAVVVFHHYPLLLGTALLAYSFGLRHAVDADHIAAIDNVTRKLMQQGQRPVGVGFNEGSAPASRTHDAEILNFACQRISHGSRWISVPHFRMGLLDGLMLLFCSSQPHRPTSAQAVPRF